MRPNWTPVGRIFRFSALGLLISMFVAADAAAQSLSEAREKGLLPDAQTCVSYRASLLGAEKGTENTHP